MRHASAKRTATEKTQSVSLNWPWQVNSTPTQDPVHDFSPAVEPCFGHDFSRVPVFSKQETVGHRAPANEATRLSVSESVGIGQVQSAREASEPVAPTEKTTNVIPNAEANAAAADACTITSRTMLKAPDGTADTRRAVGIYEWVGFSVGEENANWVADAGFPASGKGQKLFWWGAPEQPGECNITATIPDSNRNCALTMNVVAPATIGMKKTQELADKYPPGTAGAGMELNVILNPLNVSFGGLKWKEEPGPAEGIDGYFTKDIFTEELAHTPYKNFIKVGADNIVMGKDEAATAPGTLPPPWEEGQFHWVIPNRYTYASAEGEQFTNTYQLFCIDANGKVTVTKQEESVNRSP